MTDHLPPLSPHQPTFDIPPGILIWDAYGAYDADPRTQGPDGFESFRDAINTHIVDPIQDQRIRQIERLSAVLNDIPLSESAREAIFDALDVTVEPVESNAPYLYAEIGKRIRTLRQERGMTQAQLAERIGLKRSSIVNAEAARQKLPIETVYAIAHEFGVNPTTLFPVTSA